MGKMFEGVEKNYGTVKKCIAWPNQSSFHMAGNMFYLPRHFKFQTKNSVVELAAMGVIWSGDLTCTGNSLFLGFAKCTEEKHVV